MERELVSKAEFARRVHRSAGRVSQWLSEKRITAEADGRIDLNKALAALSLSLDVGQQTAQAEPILPLAAAAVDKARASNDAARILRSKAESAEVKALQDRVSLLAKRGVFVRTEDVRTAFSRGQAELLQQVEASFAEIGKQVAAELKVEPRVVTVALMREWRRQRAAIAEAAAARRDGLPEIVPVPELGEGEGLPA